MSDCDPVDYSLPCSSVQGISRQEYWSGLPFPSPEDLPNPGTEPRSPTLQVDSSPAEPQGKPKIIGVGSLSLFQQIFLTQESNWGLQHCRQILYQLRYQGKPFLILGPVIWIWEVPVLCVPLCTELGTFSLLW